MQPVAGPNKILSKDSAVMENLASSKLFQMITDKETERILKCSKSRKKEYSSGTYIFEQGGIPSRLFLLLAGQVQICKDFTSGKRDVYVIEVRKYLIQPNLYCFVHIELLSHHHIYTPFYYIVSILELRKNELKQSAL